MSVLLSILTSIVGPLFKVLLEFLNRPSTGVEVKSDPEMADYWRQQLENLQNKNRPA